MLTGIDVSSHQGPEPDFTDSQLVAVKATQGASYLNPYYARQVKLARAAGCRVIHYHYPTIARDGEVEARYFLQAVAPELEPGDVLCLDWEWYDQQDDMPPASQPDARAAYIVAQDARAREYRDEFACAIRAVAPERRLILYCDTSIWKRVDTTSDALDGLWIADYGALAGQPRIQHPWMGHQWTSTGGPGGSPLDRNVWRFEDLAEFDAWAAPARPEPEQPPQGDGQDRHVPAGYGTGGRPGPYSDILTLQRLQRAAVEDVLTGTDYDHRYQALASLAAIGLADRITPPEGTPWSIHVRYWWERWQRSLGYAGAAADGVPGPASVAALAQRVGLAYHDEHAQRGDGQDRHEPAGYPYSDTLTVQRLMRAATTDSLDGLDYDHRYQALASLRALGIADRITPPEGTRWRDHFRYWWSAWQRSLGYAGAAADGVPGPASVWRLAQRVGLAYWDEEKRSAADPTVPGRVTSPVSGHEVTTPYGSRRAGLWAGKGYHTGDDYATGRTGVPTVAIRDGDVTVLESPALGCVAVLSADNGRHYWYCHLQRGSRTVGRVKAGQQIGLVGMTGNTTGPHLHIEDNASPTRWGTDRRPAW